MKNRNLPSKSKSQRIVEFEFEANDYAPFQALPPLIGKAAYDYGEGERAPKFVDIRYSVTGPTIQKLLKALHSDDSDCKNAFLELIESLRNEPLYLAHPYVMVLIKRMYSNIHSFMPIDTSRSDEILCRLVQAWAEGITLHKLVISRAKPKRLPKSGRPMEMFPKLKEREGWKDTPASAKAFSQSRGFLRDYLKLSHRLKQAVPWKAECIAFRANDRGTVRRVAPAVETVFEEFKAKEGYLGRSVSTKEALQDSIKNKSPRDWLTCCLLSTLTIYPLPGRAKLTPGLVRKTFETLRKDMDAQSWELFKGCCGVQEIDQTKYPSRARDVTAEDRREALRSLAAESRKNRC